MSVRGLRLWVGGGLTFLMSLGIIWASEMPAGAEELADIRINELTWAGSSLSAQDEWIELYNPNSESVDIGGWQLTKNTGVEELMITIPEGAVIAANGYWLVANFDDTGSVVNIAPDMVDAAITLSNTNLAIKLYRGDWSLLENLVDAAGDGGAPPAGNNTLKLSMERSSDGSGWHDAVAVMNLDEGVIDKATPGATNSELQAPPELHSIEPTTAIGGEGWTANVVLGQALSTEPGSNLSLACGSTTIVASSFEQIDSNRIENAEFDLTEAPLGSCDLRWLAASGDLAILPAAVEILPPEPDPDMSTLVRLNEVYPRPGTGSNDEFIELINIGDRVVELEGWQIDDAVDSGSSPYTFGQVFLPARGLLVIYKPESKITLNDTGDTVRLIQPNGNELDTTSYDSAAKSMSWSRNISQWQWTSTPTPQAVNIFTEIEAETEDDPEEQEEEDDLPAATPRIVINELLPNPDDSEEWIELHNLEAEPASLDGWRIEDASGRGYTLRSTHSIAGYGYLVIMADLSNIALNNTGGEQVRLSNPAGNVADTVSYVDKAPVQVSYSRDPAGVWWWTAEATPGNANVIAIDEVEDWPGNTVSSSGTVLGSEVAADSLPLTGNGSRLPAPIVILLIYLLGILWWLRRKSYGYNDQDI